MYSILIVDDEENIVNALKRSLRKVPEWEVETFTSSVEALNYAKSFSFDLFVSDFRMPEMDGVEFLTKIKEIQPDSARIILSGYTDFDGLIGAINQAEIFRFITKPWNDYELILTIDQALKYKNILIENKNLEKELREQKEKLNITNKILAKLEQQTPGITNVNWSTDGSIETDDN